MEEENNYHADAMKEIEESLRRDQEENKNLPESMVIDGIEFTNIRVRDIQLEPKLDAGSEEEENQPLEVKERDGPTEEDLHEARMKEIEESLRRDQEENKNLPEKIEIDGLEFTNIRVREISLEPKLDENENQEPEPIVHENIRVREISLEPKLDENENQEPEPIIHENIRAREISLEPKPEQKKEQEPKVSTEQPKLKSSLQSKAPSAEPTTKQLSTEKSNLQNTNQQPKSESSPVVKYVVISAVCLVVSYIVTSFFK